jgi:hypothetical protein
MRSATQVPYRPVTANYKPLTCTDSVSEGGLEPLAYILHSSADTWLDLPTQAVEP